MEERARFLLELLREARCRWEAAWRARAKGREAERGFVLRKGGLEGAARFGVLDLELAAREGDRVFLLHYHLVRERTDLLDAVERLLLWLLGEGEEAPEVFDALLEELEGEEEEGGG